MGCKGFEEPVIAFLRQRWPLFTVVLLNSLSVSISVPAGAALAPSG